MGGDRSRLPTEGINPRTTDIDTLGPREIVERIHAEDRRAVEAVGAVLDDVAEVVERLVRALESGGRLFYVGAGTSGRLGVLDAAELPPTFGTDPSRVQAILAGGPDAMWRAREGAEDVPADGAAAVAEHGVDDRDLVVGIAAGSTTPFVLGALREAIRRGAGTVFLTCVPPADAPIASEVDVVIAPLTGPEAIAGSTRMKAGTATKLVLNMLTTAAMVRMGKTYGNLMVDLQVTAAKLEDRGRRILRDLLGVSYDEAGGLLRAAGGRVKVALVMHRRSVDRGEAERLLEEAGGFLRRAWGE
ncbi:MAG TPA: N-acetylmuramic acid 6-phosphate etherase [Gemmatimonadota bacterium]|nr:N-acetylmuramic acid 6-phosphate etherase [Gemmatimonadota bacterium]